MLGEIGFVIFVVAAITCLVLSCGLYIARKPINSNGEDRLLGGLLVFAVCLAVFYQFAVPAVILSVIVLRKPKLFQKNPHKLLVASLAILAAFWFTLLFCNQSWIDAVGLGDATRTYLRSIRLAFFSFPDLYTPVFRAWADSMPLLGIFLGLAIAGQVISFRHLSLVAILKSPAVPVLIIVLIMGLQPPQQIQARYSHFLYPLALCIGMLSAAQLGAVLKRHFLGSEILSKISAMFLCVVAFTISEDLNAYHLSHLNSNDVVFRTGRYEKFEKHWYPRWDFRKPSELVNRSASLGDRIIVSHKVNTAAAYLSPEFAVFWPRENVAFASISRDRGTRELWSGSRLLSTFEDVAEYGQKADSVWLVVLDHENDELRVDPRTLWPGRVRDVEIFTPGRDKRIQVWKIDLTA
jgi:hypothetical protein